MIKKRTETLLTAAGATTTARLRATDDYQRAAVMCFAVGGQWDFYLEASVDGSSWARVSATLTLAAGAADTIFLSGSFPFVRLNAARTGGTADAVVVYTDLGRGSN